MFLSTLNLETVNEFNKIMEPKFNYVYLQKEDKILKLLITINPEIIKYNLTKIGANLNPENYIITNEEFVKELNFKYKPCYVGNFKIFGNKHKTNNYNIPNPEDSKCILYYVLNNIANKESVDYLDLQKLTLQKIRYSQVNEENSKMCLNIIEEIKSNLDIEIVNEYDYNKLCESIDYIENILLEERLNSKINLKNIKDILLQSNDNIEIFDYLNINISNKNKKVIKKEVVVCYKKRKMI